MGISGSNAWTYSQVSPAAYRALAGLEAHVRGSGLDPTLKELVRVSARVTDQRLRLLHRLHDKDLRARGENPARLALLSVFREAPNFSARERAALAWAQAVTQLSPHGVSDADYAAVRAEFPDAELVELTLAIATINAWNRLGVAFRSEPGKYQPARTR